MDSPFLDGLAGAATFLAVALLRPQAYNLVVSLAEPGLLESWPLPLDLSAESGLSAWREATNRPVTEEVLAADYARLFVGPGPAVVWPFESVHRSAEHLVFEEHTLAVRAAYAEFGWSAPRLGQEPDDHLGLELHFVALLAEQILADREAGELESPASAALAKFAREHLCVWAEMVAGALVEQATTEFYRGVGFMLRSMVTQLREKI